MHLIRAAAIAAVAFPAIAAAQGGGGVQNPAPAPVIQARSATHDVGNAAPPVFDGQVMPFDNATLPAQSSEGMAGSANSLPRNAAPASTSMAIRMESARGETVQPGRLATNNGSGIPQTAASMPPGAMTGTIPQMNADRIARYQATHKDSDLAAHNARLAARAAPQTGAAPTAARTAPGSSR